MTDTTTTTSASSALDTIHAVYAAFGRGDIAGLLDLVDDDVDWGRTVDGVPHLEHGLGKTTAVAYFQAVGETMEFHGFAPRLFAVVGDTVVVVLDVELTVRPTGKRISFDEVHEFTVHDGRIVRYRPHLDTAQMIEAFSS